MKKIAVFASGSGSDFQSVIDANEKDPFCEIGLLVASKEGIYALERAQQHGIPAIVCRARDFASAEAFGEELIRNCMPAASIMSCWRVICPCCRKS